MKSLEKEKRIEKFVTVPELVGRTKGQMEKEKLHRDFGSDASSVGV